MERKNRTDKISDAKNSISGKELWLFWGILAIAVGIRLIGFGKLPFGVNQDEAMGAIDGWALSRYGTDRFGVRFPVHFSAWQVSQMSVLLSYLMVPFFKLFGFSTTVVRIPILLASIGGIVLMYLIGKHLFSRKAGFIAMALTAVNPWHFMQSRWSLDCNLFPHVFLLGFFLLLLAVEESIRLKNGTEEAFAWKKHLLLMTSMVIFGLTFYCYGIAVYSVTAFLAVYAVWCLKKKVFSWRELLCAVMVFLLVALPEILVMAINLFHWQTIDTGWITMSRFPESVRGNDILFLHFSFAQLWKNFLAMVKVCLIQTPDYWFNTIPWFGPLYHISIPFMVGGTVILTGRLFREKDLCGQAGKLAVWGFLLTGIWVGLITYEVNVNRINIIFYPLILMTAYAISFIGDRFQKTAPVIGAAFGVCGILFLGTYFTVYPEKVAVYYNGDFLEAVQEADREEQSLYITGNMGWQFNLSMAEILTQYACKTDALYFQGKTNVTEGRTLQPYSERYHFINVESYDWEHADQEGIYLLQQEELQKLPVTYQLRDRIGQFVIIKIGKN